MFRPHRLLGLSILLSLLDPSIAAVETWRGADGRPLPFTGEDEVLKFLKTASIASSKPLKHGINHSRKLLLDRDGVQAHAVFRVVHIDQLRQGRVRGILRLRLRDDCMFEAAAYRLSRLLGTADVPPTVVRTIDGQRGTVQLWVENAIPEAERRRRKKRPPDPIAWSRQVQLKLLFDALVFNDDRNLNNWLIDPDWKVWLIDHTRTFDAIPRFLFPGRVYWCSRKVWEKLQSLQADSIRAQMQPFLDEKQIDALLERRRLLVEHIQKLIAAKGEDAVLY